MEVEPRQQEAGVVTAVHARLPGTDTQAVLLTASAPPQRAMSTAAPLIVSEELETQMSTKPAQDPAH